MAFSFLSSSPNSLPGRPSSSAFTPRRCLLGPETTYSHLSSTSQRLVPASTTPNAPTASANTSPSPSQSSLPPRTTRPRTIAIIGKAPAKSTENVKEVTIDVEGMRKGLFGMRANAYWESMGVLPLFFAAFGLTALTIKMVKLKGGQLRGGAEAVNRMTVPKTAITSEEQEAELHVFKCGGCGYEMYPARGREFKFFPDSFKCPLCGTPKSQFWDLNDPDDPRNQTDEDEGDEDDDSDSNGDSDPQPVAPAPGAAVQASADEGGEPLRADGSSDTRPPSS